MAPKKNPHHQLLMEKVKRGGNRHIPGYYPCSCGRKFTGLSAWERHRAEELSKEKVSSSN